MTPTTHPQRPGPLPPPPAIRVLLVEDNPGDARLVREFLRQNGGHEYLVVEADRLATALEVLQSQPVDIVLLDLGLPDSQGMDTVKGVREVNEELPVIVFTGSDDSAMAQEAIRNGCQDYLVKGELDDHLLRRVIGYAIERQRAHSDLVAAKREAEQANEIKARYLASVSHKLRTPLNTILGLSELILSGVVSDSDQARDYVRDMHTSGGELLGIIDEALDIARIDAALKSEHHTYRQLVEMSPDCICITNGGAIGLVNSAGAALFGAFDPASLDGEPLAKFIHPDYHPLLDNDCEALIEESAPVPMKFVRPAGGHIDVMVSAVRFSGEARETLLVARNINELTKTTKEVVHQNKRLSSILDTAVDAILVADGEGRLETYNHSAERMFGYAPADVIGAPITKLLPEAEHLFTENPGGAAPAQTKGRRKDGSTFPAEVSVTEARLDTNRLVTVIIRDTTQRKRYEERLQHLAMHDVLTDLPNRTLLHRHLTRVVEDARRDDRLAAVTYLNLAGIKIINESLGHDAGDTLLADAGNRLSALLPEGDMVARFGGNEFVAVQASARDTAEIEAFVSRMIDALSQPFSARGRKVVLTGSFGISVAPLDGETPEELIRQANMAMLAAKREGKNVHRFFDPAMDEQAQERLVLENELRLAVGQDGHFQLHYQPQMDIASAKIVGVEALVRWPHPVHGMIRPDRFIPIAEETGAVVPLGEWVLRRACRDLARLKADGGADIRLGVNVAAAQFARPGFPGVVRQVVAETGIDPDSLELEITETGLMEEPEAVLRVLDELKELGLRVSIDDFGTGYSSLAYLNRFPVDTLKIDRSFISNIGNDPLIPVAVVQLAHSMGLSVIAEGVETEDQLEILEQLKCETAQGYLIAKPMPFEDLQAHLSAA